MTTKPKKIWITPPEQAPMQVDENGDTLRQMFGSVPEKKDWVFYPYQDKEKK